MTFMNALSLFILGAQKYVMHRGGRLSLIIYIYIHGYLSDIPTFVDRPYHQHTQRYFCITVIEQDTKNLLGEPSASL